MNPFFACVCLNTIRSMPRSCTCVWADSPIYPRLPQINEGDVHRAAGGYLNSFSDLSHLFSVLLIGGSDRQGQQMPQCIDCQMDFRAFAFLGAVDPARPPLSGIDCRVRLSMLTALGVGCRSQAMRNSMRRSCAIDHPALNQPTLRLQINRVSG
jgi:hypothetical protein